MVKIDFLKGSHSLNTYFIKLLLQLPYSIPSVGDYCGAKYSLHCNFPEKIFHMGGFPLPSPEGIRL